MKTRASRGTMCTRNSESLGTNSIHHFPLENAKFLLHFEFYRWSIQAERAIVGDVKHFICPFLFGFIELWEFRGLCKKHIKRHDFIQPHTRSHLVRIRIFLNALCCMRKATPFPRHFTFEWINGKKCLMLSIIRRFFLHFLTVLLGFVKNISLKLEQSRARLTGYRLNRRTQN